MPAPDPAPAAPRSAADALTAAESGEDGSARPGREPEKTAAFESPEDFGGEEGAATPERVPESAAEEVPEGSPDRERKYAPAGREERSGAGPGRSGRAEKGKKAKKKHPVRTALLIALAVLLAVTAGAQVSKEIGLRMKGGRADGIAAIRKAKVGSTVRFGRYPQTADGRSDLIEWTVPDNDGDSVTLISTYVLDCMPYAENSAEAVWATSGLRQWLNGEFYREAFSDAEKASIRVTHLKNLDNPVLGTDGGDDTDDRVFALSVEEIDEWLATAKAKTCTPTEYALSKQVYVFSDGSCEWWLRSPGGMGNFAARVLGGSVDKSGGIIYDASCGVRPVIVLDRGS